MRYQTFQRHVKQDVISMHLYYAWRVYKREHLLGPLVVNIHMAFLR